MLTPLEACPRCGYDPERDRQKKLALGHTFHRLRVMLYVDSRDGLGLIWVCANCQFPGEAIVRVERRLALPDDPGPLSSSGREQTHGRAEQSGPLVA
jgi:hypothetical protein